MRLKRAYGLLAGDKVRNDLIFNDVLSALEAGRSPVVITERKDHLWELADRLSKLAKNVIVFHGGTKAKAQREAEDALRSVPDHEERVLLATGRYLGEGFDGRTTGHALPDSADFVAWVAIAICAPS